MRKGIKEDVWQKIATVLSQNTSVAA